jgi:hypothetical protein
MNLSRWLAVAFVGVYLAVCAYGPGEEGGPEFGGRDQFALSKGFGAILLVLGFVSVWWSETLGDALWMGRGAWNPKPSSGPAIAILGWLFLAGALLLCLAGDDFLREMMGVPR